MRNKKAKLKMACLFRPLRKRDKAKNIHVNIIPRPGMFLLYRNDENCKMNRDTMDDARMECFIRIKM